MKKLLIAILGAVVCLTTYAQSDSEILEKFRKSQDSLSKLQNNAGNKYMEFKNKKNDAMADKWADESSLLFQKSLQMVLDYVKAYPKSESLNTIISESLFMFDADLKSLEELANSIKDNAVIDQKLKSKILNNYNKKKQECCIGKVATDFTFKDINGKSVSLSDYKGKYVWLNFWTSW